jgi:autotransporter translocation and assembly factor TamB
VTRGALRLLRPLALLLLIVLLLLLLLLLVVLLWRRGLVMRAAIALAVAPTPARLQQDEAGCQVAQVGALLYE